MFDEIDAKSNLVNCKMLLVWIAVEGKKEIKEIT